MSNAFNSIINMAFQKNGESKSHKNVTGSEENLMAVILYGTGTSVYFSVSITRGEAKNIQVFNLIPHRTPVAGGRVFEFPNTPIAEGDIVTVTASFNQGAGNSANAVLGLFSVKPETKKKTKKKAPAKK